TIHPLVTEEDRSRCEGAPQVVPGRLGLAERVHDAPARSGPEVLKEPDERAAAALATPPLREAAQHHLAGRKTGQGEVSFDCGVPQYGRVDAVQELEVEISHIVEIPSRGILPRHPRFPAGVM